MELQIATLCDSASDYQGKLCLLGTFDTIFAGNFPVMHPTCTLALRFCFRPGDEGKHQFNVRLNDENGNGAGQPIESELEVRIPPDETFFITRNLIMNIQRLRFERAGNYTFDISIDGQPHASIPLRIVQAPAGQGSPAAK